MREAIIVFPEAKRHYLLARYELREAKEDVLMNAQLSDVSTTGRRPLQHELLFEISGDLAPAQEIGRMPAGVRQIYYVTGGIFAGPRLRGVVLPGGGDWLLERSDGTDLLDVRATLQTDDGHLIYTNYRGYVYFPPLALAKQEAGQPLEWSDYYFRTAPFFETGSEKYAWLNNVLAVGVGEIVDGTVAYSVYAIK